MFIFSHQTRSYKNPQNTKEQTVSVCSQSDFSFSSLPVRVLMTGWRSCVRFRRVGPSPTKSSETSSARLRREWCLMLTGRFCRGESADMNMSGLKVETEEYSDTYKNRDAAFKSLSYCVHGQLLVKFINYWCLLTDKTLTFINDIFLIPFTLLFVVDVPTSLSPRIQRSITSFDRRRWRR